MRIDRARFLALTAALAGCNTQPPAATPGGVLEIPTTVTQDDARDASAIAALSPDASPLFAKHEAGAPIAEGGDPPDSCTSTNATGTPADCSKIQRPRTAPQCESFDDTVDECNDMARLFKPAVAEKATKCLVARSGTNGICQFGIAAICASQAFRASCGDPSTLAECKAVAQKCASQTVSNVAPKVTIGECQGALAAVATKHRSAMLSCMSEGCTSGYCFSYLK